MSAISEKHLLLVLNQKKGIKLMISLYKYMYLVQKIWPRLETIAVVQTNESLLMFNIYRTHP